MSLLAVSIGPMELLVLSLIVLLLFGHRLPSMMRSLGQGVVEFKKGVAGIEDDDKDSSRKMDSTKADNHVGK